MLHLMNRRETAHPSLTALPGGMSLMTVVVVMGLSSCCSQDVQKHHSSVHYCRRQVLIAFVEAKPKTSCESVLHSYLFVHQSLSTGQQPPTCAYMLCNMHVICLLRFFSRDIVNFVYQASSF